MNLATTIQIYAGGPGSGRKPTLLQRHNEIKNHPSRAWKLGDPLASRKSVVAVSGKLSSLAALVGKAVQGKDTNTKSYFNRASLYLEKAEVSAKDGDWRIAVIHQDNALQNLHWAINSLRTNYRIR